MRVTLQYGTSGVDITVPEERVTVLAPRYVAGLPDEDAAFLEAVRAPLSSRPLREVASARERVAIVIADVTRPLPSERLLPWILRELAPRPAGQRHHRERHGLAPGEHRGRDSGDGRGASSPRLPGRRSHARTIRRRLALAGTGIDGEPVLHEPRVRGGRPPHRARVHRAALHGGVLGRLQGRCSRAWRTSAPSCGTTTRATIGAPAQHLGRARGKSDAGADPARRRARCRWTSASTSRSTADARSPGSICGDVLAAHDAGCAFSRRDRDGRVRAAVPDRGHDQQRLPARPEPLSGGEGDVGGGADRRGRRLHRDRGALQRRVPRARQLQDAAVRARRRRGRCSTRSSTPGFSMYDQWEAQLLARRAAEGARRAATASCRRTTCARAHLEPIADLEVGSGRGARPRWARRADRRPARRADDDPVHRLNGLAAAAAQCLRRPPRQVVKM